jgi:hypothetical protein
MLQLAPIKKKIFRFTKLLLFHTRYFAFIHYLLLFYGFSRCFFENEYKKELVVILFSNSCFITNKDLVIPYESPNYFSYKGALYLYHVLF